MPARGWCVWTPPFSMQLLSSDLALHAQLIDARVNPGARTAKEQSELVIALAPHVEDFLGELFGIAKEVQALQARHNAVRAVLRFQAQVHSKAGHQRRHQGAGGGDRWPGLAPRTGGDFRGAAHRAELLRARFALARKRSGAVWSRSKSPRAMRRGPRFPKPGERSITAMSCSRWRISWTRCIWCRWKRCWRDGIAKLRLPEESWRDREGFPADRCRHGSERRARSGPLLHQVPQPGQG